MVRGLGSVLAVAAMLPAGFTPVAAVAAPAGTTAPAAAVRARPTPEVKVDWPAAPVAGKLVTVHVRRPGVGSTTTRLDQQYGSRWQTVVHKSVSARSFVFRVRANTNRLRLRVVLPHAVSRAYSAPQPAPLVRRVAYADGLIRTRLPGRAITLLFAGRRDQVAELETDGGGFGNGCHTARLRGPAGRVIAASRPGLWRLPRTGTYRAEAVPCWGSSLSTADLTRVRLVPLDLNAAPVHLRSGKGVADVGVVTVPRTGRVMVRGWMDDDPQHLWDSVSYPSGFRLFTYQARVPDLEAGALLSDGMGSGVVTPGRYFLYPAKDDLLASASTALRTSITPEGPAVTLGDGGVSGREREFTFTGTAGTFVYPDTAADGSVRLSSGQLYRPEGTRLSGWHYDDGWMIPADGTYTLRVTPDDPAVDPGTGAGTPVSVRLRLGEILAPMQSGVASRFTLDGSDRRLVAAYQLPTSPTRHPRFAATGSTMTGPWDAIAGAEHTNYCGSGPGPNGCGDNFFSSVSDESPTSTADLSYADQGLVVLRPGAGVTGSVDLTLGP